MSLQRKFHISFLLIASFATALGVYGVLALSATRNLVARLYDEPLMGVSYSRAASATLHEARGLMNRSLLLGPDLSKTVIASLARMEGEIAEDLRIVRQRVPAADVARALDEAEGSIAEWFRSGRMILEPAVAGITALPMAGVVEHRGAVATARLDDISELVSAHGFTYRTRADAEMRASSFALIGLSSGIIVMSGSLALVFAQLLIRPIRAATRVAEDIAAGSIADIEATSRRDEIGSLFACLGTMQTNLLGRAAQAVSLLRERDQAAEKLRQINLRFDTALSNMPQGLMMCDGDSRVAVVNPQFCEIYGIDPEDFSTGTPYRDVLALSVAAGNHPGGTVESLVQEHMPVLQAGRRCSSSWTIAGGRTIAVSHESMPGGGWIATHEDITERRRSEEQIVFLAWHDALTELPNRVLFQDRLEQALARSDRGEGFALLYLDLDRFKLINDTLGHQIGDRLLRAVASRLQELVRQGDIVARLGGDEFAILQFGVSVPTETAALARRIVKTIGEPYELDGHRIVIGASVGLTLAPDDGAQSERLVKNADLALYRAKQEGGRTWRFFEASMDERIQARLALELDLRNAMLFQQFELHYQPVVCSRTRCVTGFEALLRWRHPSRGMVLPSDFIPIAEEIGMITPIGLWVMQSACAEAAAWPDHLTVAVNLSPVQFRSADLVGDVRDALRSSGLAPERLGLEITESMLLGEDQATLAILHKLRALGTHIAMDDFGTGYSSLSYLRSFPFDTIKIDRSFIKDLATSDESLAILRAVTGLSSSLRMNTIAEGVETEEQFAILAAEGCAEIQGYLFSKPAPSAEIPALIDRLSGRRASVRSLDLAAQNG